MQLEKTYLEALWEVRTNMSVINSIDWRLANTEKILNTREKDISYLSKVLWGLWWHTLKKVDRSTMMILSQIKTDVWRHFESDSESYERGEKMKEDFCAFIKKIYFSLWDKDNVLKSDIDKINDLLAQKSWYLFENFRLIYLGEGYVDWCWKEFSFLWYLSMGKSTCSFTFERASLEEVSQKCIYDLKRKDFSTNLCHDHILNSKGSHKIWADEELYVDQIGWKDIFYSVWDGWKKVLFHFDQLEILERKTADKSSKILNKLVSFWSEERGIFTNATIFRNRSKEGSIRLQSIDNIFWERKLYVWETWRREVTLAWNTYRQSSLHNGKHYYPDVLLDRDWGILKNHKGIPYSAHLWWKALQQITREDTISFIADGVWDVFNVKTGERAHWIKKWNLIVPKNKQDSSGGGFWIILDLEREKLFKHTRYFDWDFHRESYRGSKWLDFPIINLLSWIWLDRIFNQNTGRKIMMQEHSEEEVQNIFSNSAWVSFSSDRVEHESFNQPWNFYMLKWLPLSYKTKEGIIAYYMLRKKSGEGAWYWLPCYRWWMTPLLSGTKIIKSFEVKKCIWKKVSYSPDPRLISEKWRGYDDCWELTYVIGDRVEKKVIYPDDEVTVF